MTTEGRRRVAALAAVLAAAAAPACGGDAPGGRGPDITPPPPPPVTAVDSAAPATLQVQDTVRFSGLFQRRVPTVRLLNLRGDALPASAVAWRSESDSVVGVLTAGGFALVSRAPGATRVIATVGRPGGVPLVDTSYAVVAPVLVSIVLDRYFESLLVGEESTARVQGRDSAGTVRELPDSVRARVIWRSLSPSVATVDAAGRVRAVAQGATVLEASLPALGLRDTTTLPVSRPYELTSALVASARVVGPGLEAFVAAPDGGTLYFIERGARADQTLSALTSDGAVRWQRFLGSAARALSAGRDGTAYFQDGVLLRAFGRDGQERFPAGLPCGAWTPSYAVDADGRMYCARADSLVAYAPSGALLWSRPATGALSVAVGGPDRVYTYGRGIRAFTRDGAGLWARDPGGAQVTVGAVDSLGALYVSALDASLSAVAPDGSLRWQVPDVRGVLALAPGGTLIIAESGGRRMVSALRTADGVGRWRVFNEAMLSGGLPHVGDDGRVYVTSACNVHVFALPTGDVLGRTAGRLCSYVAAAFVAGRLFVADFRDVRSVTIPARPGSEWSQLDGNAGRTRSPERP